MGLTYRAALRQNLPRIAFFLYLSRYGKQRLLEYNGLSPIQSTLEQIRSLKQAGNPIAAEFVNQTILKTAIAKTLSASTFMPKRP